MDADYSIDELLAGMAEWDASDLHLAAGSAPALRVRGDIHPFEDLTPLTAERTQELVYRILSTEQQKRLEIDRQIDVSYAVPGVARFRVNVFFQREALGAAFRMIPEKIQTLEELGLPESLHEPHRQASRTRSRHRARPARESRPRLRHSSTRSTARGRRTS